MKWSLKGFDRPIRTVVVAGFSLLLVLSLSGSAGASTLWDDGLVRLSDLQAGAEFESENGAFSFSDFDFTAIGFDEGNLQDYLVAPREDGFRLLLGFGSLFGPDSTIEMTYTVTGNGPYGIGGASIPLLWILQNMGGSPLAEVVWEASNGATMSASTMEGGWLDGVETSFDPVRSLMVRQTVSLTGAVGIVKVENAFDHEHIPEPGTGMLFAAGFGAWILTRRRSAA